jgi:putative transposase
LAVGKRIPGRHQEPEVSETTFHRWRAQHGGMKADDAKRLKELERENQQLKRIVANKELGIDALRR